MYMKAFDTYVTALSFLPFLWVAGVGTVGLLLQLRPNLEVPQGAHPGTAAGNLTTRTIAVKLMQGSFRTEARCQTSIAIHDQVPMALRKSIAPIARAQ